MTTKSSSQQPQPTGISNNEDIIHNGWLEKKGRVMKNWKRRWFILRSTILEYYDGQSGVKKGDIEITIDTKVLMRDGTTHLFKFGIQTGDRILELSTDCDDERLRWMDAIHRVVNNLTNNMNRLTLDNSGIKDRFSNLLSKKTNMEEDTPMNRVLRGHATMNDGGATTTKPTRRVNRRTRNKKTSQPLSSDKNTPAGDCQSDESDHDRDTTTIRESSSSIPEATNLPQPPPSTQPISPPLPEGWAQVVTEDGRIYYYHKITRVSRWDFPVEDEVKPNQQQQHTEASATGKSTGEPHASSNQIEDEDQINALVTLSIKHWLQPVNMNRTRSIPELLTAIPTVLDTTIIPEGAICREPLTISSSPSDVKKAYLRAIRLVHPDKLVGVELTYEQRLLAQEVFIHISEKYDLYRKAHGL